MVLPPTTGNKANATSTTSLKPLDSHSKKRQSDDTPALESHAVKILKIDHVKVGKDNNEQRETNDYVSRPSDESSKCSENSKSSKSTESSKSNSSSSCSSSSKSSKSISEGSKAGSKSTGHKSTRSKSTGSKSTGSKSTDSKSTGSKSTGRKSTGSKSTFSKSTGSKSTGSKSTGSKSTGSKSTGSKSSGSESPGSESPGSESPGSKSTGSKSTGSKSTGSKGTGSKGSDSKGSDSKGSDSKSTDSKSTDSKGTDSKDGRDSDHDENKSSSYSSGSGDERGNEDDRKEEVVEPSKSTEHTFEEAVCPVRHETQTSKSFTEVQKNKGQTGIQLKSPSKIEKKSRGSGGNGQEHQPRKRRLNFSENTLTHLLPGYVAPMRLVSKTLERTRPQGGLQAMCENAARQDAQKGLDLARRVAQQSSASMSFGGISSEYRATHAAVTMPKKQRKKANAPTTAGEGWFNMRSTAMTEELKQDMTIIRNRNYLDPKRFYKSADTSGSGKSFIQVGTVVEGPTEYFSSRLTKKQRRSNLVEELLADPQSSSYVQNKYKKMQQEQGDLHRQWKKRNPNSRAKDFRKLK
ncbi:hypothetical protein ACA910_020019 [Epithemia clementina (nom. ined.)]